MSVDVFPVAALDDNKAGRLTKDQRKGFSGLERSVRWDRFTFGLILGAMAALVATATGPAPNAQYRPLAVAGLGAASALCFFLAFLYPDALTRDLRSGRVESVEGAIGKRSVGVPGAQANSTLYYLDVADRHFQVHSLTYQTAPESGWVRLYFLPRSHKVVNLERLADKEIPKEAFSSPMSMVAGMVAAMRSHDSARINEARAEMGAAMNQFEAMRPQPTARPNGGNGGGANGGKPLAQAILGTWSMGPMSVTFRPDGTVEANALGRRQRGHWSVDSAGKLHSDAMGKDEAADAWISGDILTISDGNDPMALRRAG